MSPDASYGLRRGEIEGRFDVAYYRPDFRENVQRLRQHHPNIQSLSTYADVVCGPFGSTIKLDDYVSEGIPLLRISNISDDGRIDETGLVFIRESLAATLGRTLVSPGDLVVSQRGTLGVPAVVPNTYARWAISANLIAIKRLTIWPAFVQAFLSSKPGAKQLERAQSGQVQGKITTSDVASLLIPKIDNDKELINLLNAARTLRQTKLREANDLLSSLDGFVLEKLGLTLPLSERRMAYGIRVIDARVRFDPDYHSPLFRTLRKKILSGPYKPRTIRSICSFIQSGFAAGGNDQTDDPTIGVPHIRPLNITNTAELHFEGTKMVPRSSVTEKDWLKQGEILFNNTNSTTWVGKSVVFDSSRECVCSNHITRLQLKNIDDNPYFFAAVLNALRGLGYFGLLSTNFNNQAGINVETLETVLLPWPKTEIQKKIASEVDNRRAEARRLRDEANALWEQAKVAFETALLGPQYKGE